MRIHSFVLSLALLGLLASPAFAGHGNSDTAFYDKARVVDVVPIHELVRVTTPHRECWTEEVEHTRHHGDATTYTLVGSIIGGVVGHQFGKGGGKKAATVAGTLIGAATTRPSEPCRALPGAAISFSACA